MLTAFKKYRNRLAKIAVRDAAAPSERKRTKAVAVANGIGMTVSKVGELDLTSFSAEDRTMLIETMTALKEPRNRPSPWQRTRRRLHEHQSSSRRDIHIIN